MDKLKLNIQYFANATCTLTVTESVNKTGNSSTFTITGKVTTGSQTYNSSAYMKGSYSGGATGTLSKKTFSISKSDSVSKSWEITVNHNSDGTLDDIKFTLDWYVTSSDTSHGTVTKTISPTDIPRKATIITALNFTDDEDPIITYNNPAGDSVTTLQARIASSDNAEGYTAYRTINKFVENDDGSKTTTGLSYTFKLTSEEQTLLRQKASSSNSLDVRFVVKTVIDGDTFTSYLTKKMTIANPEPTVTATVVDSNPVTLDLTKDENTFIKYFSSASYEITAEAKKESTIKSYGASCGSKSKLTNPDVFENVDSGTFIFTATDSRKNTTSTTLIKNLVEYVKLTCNISDNRPDVNGEMLVECSGNYFNNTFGAVENTLSVQYRYKESGGEYNSWTPMTISLDGNSYTATADLSDLDYTKNYIFQTRAIDALHPDGINSIEKSVRTIPVYDWGEDDFAVNEDFSVVKNSTFGGNVDINGTLSISGTVLSELLKPQINTLTAYIDSTRNLAIRISAANTKYNISLNGTLRNIGTKLVLDDDGIIIGSGVQYVRVSGNVMCQGITGDAIMSILNNTTTISEGYMYIPNTTAWKSISLSPQVIPVSEGDVISMKISDSATGTILISRSTRTYLTVEVVG